MTLSVQHRFLDVNGIRLHVAEAGSGPLLILLHGFPETWYSFRYQIQGLSASFRIVAPDLRGCGESAKPPSGYDVATLASDIEELITALGQKDAFVGGHDWGGVVAWRLASHAPGSVRKLIILNCPHPAVFLRTLGRSPCQILRSSYMFFFQIPWVPERLLRFRRAVLLEALLKRSHPRADALTEADLEVYRAAWLTPGALEGALAYYRTMMRRLLSGRRRAGGRSVPVPTLLIWGEKDGALGPALHEGNERYVEAPFEKVILPEAGHFVHQDAPEEVNRALARFLSGR